MKLKNSFEKVDEETVETVETVEHVTKRWRLSQLGTIAHS